MTHQAPIDTLLADQGLLEDKTRKPRARHGVGELRRSAASGDYRAPDGLVRPNEVEHELNSAAHSLFTGPVGEHFIDYLRSITVNQVIGPGGDLDRGLVHLEGARWLLGVIETRVAHGARREPAVSHGTEYDDGN